jgi:hypothetical protein
MNSKRLVLGAILLAACSKKQAEPAAESQPANAASNAKAPPVATAQPTAAPAPISTLPPDRIDYDLPMVGDRKGGFDVSFALLHLGREDSGQGDLVVFGPEVKEGDKGTASDWTDVCSTRLNAFPYASVHGFRIPISNLKQLPAAGPAATLEPSTVTFDLQGEGWGLSQKDLEAHPFKAGVRLLTSDGKEAELEVQIHEPGKDGSLRGRLRAKICPSA